MMDICFHPCIFLYIQCFIWLALSGQDFLSAGGLDSIAGLAYLSDQTPQTMAYSAGPLGCLHLDSQNQLLSSHRRRHGWVQRRHPQPGLAISPIQHVNWSFSRLVRRLALPRRPLAVQIHAMAAIGSTWGQRLALCGSHQTESRGVYLASWISSAPRYLATISPGWSAGSCTGSDFSSVMQLSQHLLVQEHVLLRALTQLLPFFHQPCHSCSESKAPSPATS